MARQRERERGTTPGPEQSEHEKMACGPGGSLLPQPLQKKKQKRGGERDRETPFDHYGRSATALRIRATLVYNVVAICVLVPLPLLNLWWQSVRLHLILTLLGLSL